MNWTLREVKEELTKTKGSWKWKVVNSEGVLLGGTWDLIQVRENNRHEYRTRKWRNVNSLDTKM